MATAGLTHGSQTDPVRAPRPAVLWAIAVAFETIRRATSLVIGLAPLAFLAGLLHARLVRSAVGDLRRGQCYPVRRSAPQLPA